MSSASVSAEQKQTFVEAYLWNSHLDSIFYTSDGNVVIRSGPGGDVCGRPTRNSQGGIQKTSRIVGGKSALDGSYPWFALLYNITDRQSFCGGSIINKRWIVTAAHCLVVPHPDGTNIYRSAIHTIKLLVGTTDCQGDGGKALTIDTIIIHPGYAPGYDNDIALIRVKEEINFTPTVQPICLESQSFNKEEFFRKGDTGYVAGCGTLSSNSNEPAKKLMEVKLQIRSRQVCMDSLKSTANNMTESMFCAGHSLSSRGDACQGDSGGGFVFKSSDRFVLVGVVSWGIGCDESGQYGFYTNVGRFFSWIHQSID